MLSKSITPYGTANTQPTADVQVGTMSGKNFIYPPNIQPKDNIPNPKNTNGSPNVNLEHSNNVSRIITSPPGLSQNQSNIHDNPPPYSAPAGRSMNEMKVIRSKVDVNNLSPEQFSRRSFFFQLINTLTKRLTSFVEVPNGDWCTWDEHIWDVNGRTYRSHCCESYTVPEGNPEMFKRFATRIALGLSYVYQYIIPLLDDDNNRRLADYFAHSFTLISSRAISSYSILMSTLFQYSPDPESDVCDLKTDKGFEFSFNHILSMGLQTIEGYSYVPTNPKNVLLFNQLIQNGIQPYRLGTIDVITLDLLSKLNDKKQERSNNCIYLHPVQGALSINIDEEINKASKFNEDMVVSKDIPNALSKKTIFNQFWENVDNFACQYLTNEELQSYKQFISSETCQDFLLAPVYRPEAGGGNGG